MSICKIFQHLVQSSERHPSAVQTPGFSPPAPAKKNMAPGKKSPAPPENFQLRQIRENSKWKQIFVFDFNIWTFRMNISYYVCGKPTQYQCEYLLFRRWIQVFSPMSDSIVSSTNICAAWVERTPAAAK